MIEGIDTSIAQGKDAIDWQRVARADRHFAFLKATDGAPGFQDDAFDANVDRAKAAGLLVGAYHFFQVTDDPIEQAKFLARVAKSRINFLPMIDIETLGHKGRERPIAEVLAKGLECTDAIEQAFGLVCVVYTFSKFWPSWPDAFGKRPLFVAQYNRRDAGIQEPEIPKPWTRYTFHQYAADPFLKLGIPAGHCDGVPGPVDCDRFNGTIIDLHELAWGPIEKESGLVLGNDGPPNDPYYVDRAEAALDSDPPDTDPQSPTARSSQRIAAVTAPMCTCDSESVVSRTDCPVHAKT